jgi:hypothetical protein
MKSIVIRGAICHNNKPNNHINNCINSIRKWFTDELIIVTWDHQKQYLNNTKNVDNIILLSDPGPGPIQNILRQVYSYKEGILNASGTEILIIRSDMSLSKDIFNFINYDTHITDTLKIMKNKIIINNIMTINPNSNEISKTFRISDWLHCGFKQDLEKLYYGIDYIKSIDVNKIMNLFNNGKICTEKLWMLSMLKSFYDYVDLYNSSNIDEYCWEFILNNFTVLNGYSTLGIYNYNYPNQSEKMSCYLTQEEYENSIITNRIR